MLLDWSAECGAEDPLLVVPWASDDPEVHFIDLRQSPYDLDHIPEAEQHPALMQALRSLNAARSPVFTAKCDAWPMQDDEIAFAHAHLELAEPELTHGFMSYIDLVWRERSLFVSPHRQEQRLDRLTRLLEPLDFPLALGEAVLRPALIDLAGPQEGFSVTLYVKGLGRDADGAYATWSEALLAVVTVLRSKEFTFA